MTKNELLFDRIFYRAKKELIPELTVGYKSQFFIHRFLNAFFNLIYPSDMKNAYLNRYTTILGYSIAFSNDSSEKSGKLGRWRVLCHEVVHALQAKTYTRGLYSFLYMYPVSLGIVLLLTCWIPFIFLGWTAAGIIVSSAWFVIALVNFIPQLDDPWRTEWELEAYKVTLYLYFMVHGTPPRSYVDRLVWNFHSMAYYMMTRDTQRLQRVFENEVKLLEQGMSSVKNHPIVQIAEEEYEEVVRA